MVNVYVRLMAIEVRLSVGVESWNEEPLNPLTNSGTTRGTNGCLTSRTVGTVDDADVSATLEKFRCVLALNVDNEMPRTDGLLLFDDKRENHQYEQSVVRCTAVGLQVRILALDDELLPSERCGRPSVCGCDLQLRLRGWIVQLREERCVVVACSLCAEKRKC